MHMREEYMRKYRMYIERGGIVCRGEAVNARLSREACPDISDLVRYLCI